ncbi:MAG: hypothetical protein NTU80_13670 [Verrucomicrobia bacterium]|nr:hypothetical protein [Verrucomicrobiota bacterium]
MPLTLTAPSTRINYLPTHLQVTRAMISAHTRDLAARAGRTPPYVSQTDYEQAKLELTGVSDFERQNALILP